VHALIADGVGIKGICRQLDLSRGTVRRFARADTVEELLTRNGTGHRASLLEEFKNPIYASASQLDTPTRPSCSPRSPRAAIGAVRPLSASTCTSSALPLVSLRRRANRPRSAASPLGS
jgi:hypothetical protein